MTIDEVAKVLAKVQLVDNREVTRLVILEWQDLIGDLDYSEAIEAVREHRRTSTEYLQPAHLVAIAGKRTSSVDSIDDELQAGWKAAALEAAGVTAAEFAAHEHDVEWLRARFGKLGELE